ncbi:hypothetical protein [Methylosinus sp. Ce-a6]|uniref:hypothetical protein n=1 Tax=Methylosinus sp. Ce-a6 TaxID=2172005 RepID=UPI00135C8C8C|nr:hypothetical protein [Methylosinus sp. Ce-a6]
MIEQPVTVDDARRSLEAAERAEREIFQARSYVRAAPYLVLWGAIWILGFLLAAYAAPGDARMWPALSALGAVASLVIAWRQNQRRRADLRRGLRTTATAFLIAFYAGLWPAVLLSHNPNRFGVYAGTVTGAAYLIAGLWAAPLILWLGLVVTGVFLAGLVVDPAIFPAYAALLGGGGLIAAGLLLRGKKAGDD